MPTSTNDPEVTQKHLDALSEHQSKAVVNNNPNIAGALRTHNEARHEAHNHGRHLNRPDLVWDDNLAQAAMVWAKHLTSTGKFEHDPNAHAGENLYGASGFQPDFAAATKSWNSEETKYTGQKIGDGDFHAYGHYTQVVWPTTTHVGMAEATSASGFHVIVARYLPQGNIVGQSAW